MLDAGGSWVGPRHGAVLGLLDELGIPLVPQFRDGLNLMRVGGRTYRCSGDVPRLRPHELLDIGQALWQLELGQLDRMAAHEGEGPMDGAVRAGERAATEVVEALDLR